MDIVSFLIPITIVGVIGLVIGEILALASRFMSVPKDETAEALEEALPGANCGACGFSGCSGYAGAMSKGAAGVGLCPPGGEAVADACAKILGIDKVKVKVQIALVHCLGSQDNISDRMIYNGIESCAAIASLVGNVASCRFSCIGKGDCIKVCEYDAIQIVKGIAIVEPQMCKGCGKCVDACPKDLIKIASLKKQAVVRCSNCDKAKNVASVCKVGCIGCMQCVKVCQYGAVQVKDNLAFVNAELCTGCGQCVEACPRYVISLLNM